MNEETTLLKYQNIKWEEEPLVVGQEFGQNWPNLVGYDDEGNKYIQMLDRWYAIRLAIRMNDIERFVVAAKRFEPNDIVAFTFILIPDGKGAFVHLADETDIERHKQAGCLMLSRIKKRKPKPKRAKVKRGMK